MGQFVGANGGSDQVPVSTFIGIVIVCVLGLSVYFFPLIVAVSRKVPNLGSVAVVNAFLGWTFLGWVAALAMACRSTDVVFVATQPSLASGAPPRPQSHPAPVAPKGWLADPTRRHQLRYWSGTAWTEHVSDNGVQSTDPI